MIRILAIFVTVCLPMISAAAQLRAGPDEAVFAGGCFWCVEADFDKVKGVVETISGYTGGTTDSPTYSDHVEGRHREAVLIRFDPAQVSYERLLEVFFRSVDPTDDGGQFCDRGHSYTTAIYAVDETQMEAAHRARAAASEALGLNVVTPIEQASAFWPAEDYHQNFHRSQERMLSRFGLVTRADAYKSYRQGCGRDVRLRQLWGEAALIGIGG